MRRREEGEPDRQAVQEGNIHLRKRADRLARLAEGTRVDRTLRHDAHAAHAVHRDLPGKPGAGRHEAPELHPEKPQEAHGFQPRATGDEDVREAARPVVGPARPETASVQEAGGGRQGEEQFEHQSHCAEPKAEELLPNGFGHVESVQGPFSHYQD